MNLTFSEVLDFLEQYKIAPKFRIGEILDVTDSHEYGKPYYLVRIIDVLLTSSECKFLYKVEGVYTDNVDYFTEVTLQQYQALNGQVWNIQTS